MNIESILMVYFFPVQLMIGLIGNFLNLVVLLNKRMRSKTNMLLAMVALADIHFLIFMFPHTLMYHTNLTRNPTFKMFVIYGNIHITGIINACSFASAWLIVMVSLERMMAIIWPLRARSIWTWRNLKIIVIVIWVTGFVASIHSHITHTVTMVARNETVVNSTTGNVSKIERRGLQQALRPSMERFWRIATLVNVILVVFIPVFLVVGTNTLMIFQLSRDHNQFMHHIRNHRRATFIVFVIASTFTVCQTPSAIIYIFELLWPAIGLHRKFRTAATLSNSLVVTGKTANHFLFCMWSRQFRKNLVLIVGEWMPAQCQLRQWIFGLYGHKNHINDKNNSFCTTLMQNNGSVDDKSMNNDNEGNYQNHKFATADQLCNNFTSNCATEGNKNGVQITTTTSGSATLNSITIGNRHRRKLFKKKYAKMHSLPLLVNGASAVHGKRSEKLATSTKVPITSQI